MKKINQILCVLTEENVDKTAMLRVSNLAKKNKAHIKFIRVYDSFSRVSNLVNTSSNEVMEILLSNLKNAIEMSSEYLKDLIYTCDIREGIWFIEGIREAVRIESDLVILIEPVKKEVRFESEAMHIIRKSPIPVWLIRKNMSASNKILVAVDIDINDKIKSNVIVKSMGLAEKIAQSCDHSAELVVAHCWSLYNEWYLRNVVSNISELQINDRVNRERSFHEEWFNSFCTKYKDMNISRAIFIQGDPEEIIPQLVREENIDTLVMGTVSNISIKGLYITSRAEVILDGVSCSVLTVKPDNFSSPVI